MTISLGQSSTPTNMRIYAIGDVHGYLNLLKRMHESIKTDLNTIAEKQYKIIFLGDYIDRGPDSAGCVQYLIDLVSNNEHVVCLKGNHEKKLERFIEKPLDVAESFFKYGGIECAMSYGADLTGFNYTQQASMQVHAQIKNNLTTEHRQFYATLATSVSLGDYFFSHAGVRPGVALDNQSDDDLMHIRSDFISNKSLYEKVIVHGHTPAYPMEVLPNRINVDTCAYETGVLSCLVLEGTEYRVLEASNIIPSSTHI